ncbi:MAG TPA: ABC transporter permease, partial [Verrucomicrobiales bacterium]|nr:ABC transporter permease [Verrucomicrobiales bacterium]
MTRTWLIFNSLTHHARAHAGTLLGAIVAGAVLTGSLVIGDSVKKTLQIQAQQRLGKIQAALVQHDRFFHADLAAAIHTDDQTHFAAILKLNAAGYVSDESGEIQKRANQIQLIGIDEAFWKHAMLKANLPPELNDGEALINPRLAAQLGLKAGDEFRLRIAKPSILPRDAPLSVAEDLTARLTLTVAKVTGANSELANLSLRPGAVPPFNVFVPLAWLQQKAELDGRANVMLASGLSSTAELVQSANAALKKNWRLADAELELIENETDGVIDLRTDRIFLDANTLAATTDSQTALTYIANEFRAGTNAAPYSMISGVSEGFFENTPTGDEMLITQWLADDLGAKAGDKIEVDYYVLGLNRQLEERRHTFTVTGIVPTEKPGWRELMPNFPGIVDKDNLRDWNPGIDFDSSRIRDQDEDYWKQHRGTPKAFVALPTAQKLWANRYGEATTVRYKFAKESIKGKRAEIESALRQKLDPTQIGLVFRDVRTEAITGQSASDFGGLFIGLSFFLVIAALILMGLLFVFGVEQRAPQIGTLLAIGFTGKTVRNLLLAEGFVLALIGAALGAWAGLGYTQALLKLLNSNWSGAIGNGSLVYHAEPLTVLYGVLGGLFIALFTIWLTVRKLSRASAITLMQGEPAQPAAAPTGRKAIITAIACAVGAIALGFAMKDAQGQMKAGGFFGAGMLLLVSCLCVCHAWLGKLATGGGASFASLGAMGWRGSARRRGRSLACIGLLACGVFLLIAVGAFRLDPTEGAGERWSGTGGFAFFGQSDVPVLFDLNTQKGREEMALEGEVDLVQFRVRAGDDASCLNLNQTREPRLLGVNPKSLAEKKAFTFAQGAGWEVLDETEGNAVPAIVDMNTGMWMLHVKVGDVINYPDESGGTFKIRIAGFLANSVLQGDLIISEKQFVKHFPSASGYRMFLIDSADPKATSAIAIALSFA